MLTIHLTRRVDSTIALKISCPDSDIFQSSINALKFLIPAPSRSYHRVAKCWIILAPAARELENYLSTMSARFSADVISEEEQSSEAKYEERRHGHAAEAGRDEEEQAASHFDRRRQMTLGRAQATLFVTADAPFEVVQSAYRALAKLHHPDVKGGNEARMRVINHAYEVLTEECKLRASAA